MFRASVAVSLAVVFAAAGAVLYINLDDALTTGARAGVEQRLAVAKRALEQIRRLDEYALVARAEQVAAAEEVIATLATPASDFADEEGVPPSVEEHRYQIHRLMNAVLKTWDQRFKEAAGGKGDGLADHRAARPDFFAVVDAAGLGVAKARNPRWYGPGEPDLGKAHPALPKALATGRSVRDVWSEAGAPLQVAFAPIRKDDRVIGGVVLGYRLTLQEATRAKALVGAEVAYHLGPQVARSSSLVAGPERDVQAAVAEGQLHKGPVSPTALELTVGGHRHLARLGRLGGYASAADVGFLVLEDLDAALAKARAPLLIIPAACGLGYLLALGLVLLLFQRFVKPFERIDQGVHELLSGHEDYWFDIKGASLPAKMSQNLNILVCQLSGRPLPDEHDPGSS